jgi:cyclic nucleotide gated channel, plant
MTRLVSRIFRGSAEPPGPLPLKPTIPIHQKQAALAASKHGVAISKRHMAFVAGDGRWYGKIFDPSSDFILTWNRTFLFSCFVALFIDPFYFYVPKIVYGEPNSCVGTDRQFAIGITFLRSMADLLYILHIIIKFRTAYINPSATMGAFGRGDLVTDPKEISWIYLRSGFAVDVAAALPLPQVTCYSSFCHS